MKKPIYKYLAIVALILIVLGLVMFYFKGPQVSSDSSSNPETTEKEVDSLNLVENGIHVRTGLVDAEGLITVIANCTSCHSSKLIIQNRMDREQWNATIRWMQDTQGLWDLGDNQKIIVDYLTKNYPTFKKGRRAALTDIEWYSLE